MTDNLCERIILAVMDALTEDDPILNISLGDKEILISYG